MNMLIHRLTATGLLSFGTRGIDLPMKRLNVLIGPNGSGKSNLLELLSLLRAAPSNLAGPVKETGGVREWLWKGPNSPQSAMLCVEIQGNVKSRILQHGIVFSEHGSRFELRDEWIGADAPQQTVLGPERYYYSFNTQRAYLVEASGYARPLGRDLLKAEESVLSQLRDPERYPELHWLQEQYEQIRLYRNWSFGPGAPWRREQSAHGRADVLAEGGENLALVLSKIRRSVKNELIASLRHLYPDIDDIHLTVDGGNVQLFLEENGREIPATRLSDGTLRYLSLLAILLHPDPPPLVAIEEPELGLHPDVLPHLADLLVRASERMQLVVTTHSRMLVDALSDHPSSVVVCSKENGESRFERLDPENLRAWLEKYTLGTLWSMGELGANRW